MTRWSQLNGTLLVGYRALDVCEVSSPFKARLELVSEIVEP